MCRCPCASVALQLIAVTIAACIGCLAQHGDQRKPSTMTNLPHSPCGSQAGVRLQTVVTSCTPGKPPNFNCTLDLAISSALERPVWFVFDLTNPISSASEVSLSRSDGGPGLPFWKWGGERGLRLPPKANIQLRGVSVHASGPNPRVKLWFANELRVAGSPAAEWLGRPGLTPAGGEFFVDQGESLSAEKVRRANEAEGASIAVDLLCYYEIELSK
jgi:hypothetical protein